MMQQPNNLEVEHWPDDAIWKRRRTEGHASWMAFFSYLCLPPNERSVSAAYRDFSGDTKAKDAPPRWYTWMRMHHWQERVVEFERWRRSRDQIRQEREHAEEARKWEAIRTQERERGLTVGRALIEKAQAMLQFPIAEVERVVAVYDDGREKEVQIFKPAGWNFGTVARMIEVGSKLVRLVAEMETDRHKIDLGMIYDEADKVAASIGGGVTRDDVIAMAERIAEERHEQLEQEGRA